MVIIATGKMDKMPKAKSVKTVRHDPWRDIEDFLGTRSQEALVGRLLDVARRDDQLYQSLELEVSMSLGRGQGRRSVSAGYRQRGDRRWIRRLARIRYLPITLAGNLEATRPDHAIGLYRRVVPSIVEQTDNSAYEEAVGLVRKVGKLMQAQKQSRQFGDYLGALRVQFKPKRNFMKLLDEVARQTAG